MDSQKTGRLIAALRREKGWTQKQLAEAMHLSDRTVSKWERGAGCPELSLLPELSGLLGVAVEHLLSGELGEREADKGDMKRVQFYLCPSCGNLLCSTGTAEISCCGRKLEPLQAKPADEIHRLTVEEVDDEFFVTSSHPMEKAHYLSLLSRWSHATGRCWSGFIRSRAFRCGCRACTEGSCMPAVARAGCGKPQ